ncbi:HTH-type transcriptional regulator CdhR [Roseovarius albus]|uniref:HTH-type transcriptional regulator CdhR n=1 Tax=Roseovarius albus TaxID=1247867 RepID=A0A1X6YXY5_9RHOB|nr:helix-turn-helix domain-containing protein [Roseovarius albus]SLN34401.1 HTH-type transcriptional regulator CdhR [Roseovarius albus]
MEFTHNQSVERGQTHMVFVIIPRFNLGTLVNMTETMRIANYLSSQRSFSWEVVSFDGASVVSSSGVSVTVSDAPEVASAADYVFVLGSWGAENYRNKDLVSWLRKRARAGETICAVELGCYPVAQAGLLAGKEATSHWSWINGFQESFDTIDVKEQLFTVNNRIMTCAGALAVVDLMLHIIDKTHGSGFAEEIADQLMVDTIRDMEAPQRRTLSHGSAAIPVSIREAISLIERHIEEPLSVPEVASTLGVSQRQLERNFKKQIGCTVVQFGLLLRLQRARLLLISTDLSVREIATASGFNSLSHFAFSFGKFFDRRPSEYREAWPADEPAPSWPGTLSEFLTALQAKQKPDAA